MSPSTMNEGQRAQRLRGTLQAACYWLIAQGALQLLMSEGLAQALRLRYMPTLLPYIRQGGLALLLLGLLLRRWVQDPQRESLAVDLLALFFLARAAFMLAYRLSVDVFVPFEWLALALDLGVAACLVLWRRRGPAADQGSPLAQHPREMAREVMARWARKPTVAAAPAEPDPIPPPAAAEPSPGEAKKRSEAIPRMDG